jgi:predicted PurR-regulated permease PerM
MPDLSRDASTHTERVLKWTIFIGATALIVYLCLRIVDPFLNVIAWSSVLAITFHPLHQYFVRKTGRVSLSALLCSALVAVGFVIPLLLIAGLAVNQFPTLADALRQTFVTDRGNDSTSGWGRACVWVMGTLRLDAGAIVQWLEQHTTDVTQLLAEYAVAIAAGATGALVSFVFIIFAIFLMFRDGARIVTMIPDLLPFERTRSEALLLRIRDVIYGGVYGVIVIAVIQGALRRDVLGPRGSVRRAVGHGHRAHERAADRRRRRGVGARRVVPAVDRAVDQGGGSAGVGNVRRQRGR